MIKSISLHVHPGTGIMSLLMPRASIIDLPCV